MFEGAAAMLFDALSKRTPESPQEAAAATRALAYLAATSADADLAGRVTDRVGEIASDLADGSPADVTEMAATIAGLLSAAVATDDGSLRASAAELYAQLAADFDAEHGVFKS